MRIPLPGLTITLIVLAAIIIVVTIGLKVPPAPFSALPLQAGAVTTVPLPPGLPAPVERFYRTLYGEQIPVITLVVMTGRAKVRPFGRPTLNARFRFTHVAGRSYHHYIEATFFGLPVMRINESYVDGYSRFETPAGLEEGEPKTEQAASLGIWAELSNMPAALLTDPRVRWEPVDADGTGSERFLARFDPDTGLITLEEGQPQKGPVGHRSTHLEQAGRADGVEHGLCLVVRGLPALGDILHRAHPAQRRPLALHRPAGAVGGCPSLLVRSASTQARGRQTPQRSSGNPWVPDHPCSGVHPHGTFRAE